MRHARPDYDRFQDPLGIIPDDEPVFILRGQDAAAGEAVRAYAHFAERAGADPELVATCERWADVMDAWPKKKVPDLEGKPTP